MIVHLIYEVEPWNDNTPTFDAPSTTVDKECGKPSRRLELFFCECVCVSCAITRANAYMRYKEHF